jgi:glycosyltransferase involved in cell wall biosynthesis
LTYKLVPEIQQATKSKFLFFILSFQINKTGSMKICFISNEFFAWGKYGGFGRATRVIARELAKIGHEITAIIPRRNEQKPIEMLDGIKVLGYPLNNPFHTIRLFKEVDAEVYHSQEPSLATYMAMHVMRKKKHIITLRDTRLFSDWWVEFMYPSRGKLQVISNYMYENSWFVHAAVREADAVFCASKCLFQKAKDKYKLKHFPPHLPTPVDVPREISKADEPTICFIGRWDRVKRPEIFLDLARKMPKVKFIAVGKGQLEDEDAALRTKYAQYENIEMPGFIDQFASDGIQRILEKSWVLVNTSAKEALPNSFIEAAAHKCAIVSAINPEGFTSKFGKIVENDNYETALSNVLHNNAWEELGEKGYRYVRNVYERDRVISQHEEIYERLLMDATEG